MMVVVIKMIGRIMIRMMRVSVVSVVRLCCLFMWVISVCCMGWNRIVRMMF